MRGAIVKKIYDYLWRSTIVFAITGTGAANAQINIPGASLDYDAPVLPSILWPSTQSITNQSLLPSKSLLEKRNEIGLPYRLGINSEYKNTEGTFGQLNLGSGNTSDINYDGDIYSMSVDFAVKRNRVILGIEGAYENLDFDSYEMDRYGIAPYGSWTLPIKPTLSMKLLGTVYYFKNNVDSKLAPRQFSDYDSTGLSLSAALHFDSRKVHKAITIDTGTLSDTLSLIGSVGVSYQLNDDNADRERVYNGRKIDEVDKQAQLLVEGNVGVRAGEQTVVMLSAVYGNDLSDYEGRLQKADDDYSRVSLQVTRSLTPRWQVKLGYNQVFSDSLEYTGIYLATSTMY